MSHKYTMNEINETKSVERLVQHNKRPRSKSVGDLKKIPGFSNLLASNRVDTLVDTDDKVLAPTEITYEESPDIMDSLFENILNILINIIPPGCAIMGGSAHVLMSKKFGIKPIHYLTNIVKKKGKTEEVYTFKRDIDVILTKNVYFSDIYIALKQIGKIDIIKTADSYTDSANNYSNLKKIKKLTTVELSIPLQKDSMKKSKGILSFFASFFDEKKLKKFPKEFSICMDFVEVDVKNVSKLMDHWYVTNELRMYALKIKKKNHDLEDNMNELVPVQISSILPSSMTNINEKITIPLESLFNYVKGACWEISPLPGITRSGIKISKTTTKNLNIKSELDLIVRLGNIHSDNPVVHVANPDLWIPHIVYDESITIDTIKDTFHFGKLLKDVDDSGKNKFRDESAKRIFDHIHNEKGGCCICMDSLNEPGTSFIALPCGCTSVMHLECFMNNYISPVFLQLMKNPFKNPDNKLIVCPLCRVKWWCLNNPNNKRKFRVLNNTSSVYYHVDELLNKSIFQLHNTELYDTLKSNPKSIDFRDFI